MKILVVLNGTDENPYRRWGLNQNPFPQIPERFAACMQLQKLGGEPIPNLDYIREVLIGWDPEFVELCCFQFKKGEVVRFEVEWDE